MRSSFMRSWHISVLLLIGLSVVLASEDAVRAAVLQNRDPLSQLSETDLQRHWSDEKLLLENLRPFIEHTINLDVYLVGFDAEANGIFSKESDWLSVLQELSLNRSVFNIDIEGRTSLQHSSDSRENDPFPMGIREILRFEVHKTELNFAKTLTEVRNSHLVDQKWKKMKLSYSIIDELISKHYTSLEKTPSTGSRFAIYVLNLPYLEEQYTYIEVGGDSHACPTNHWAGKKPYLWIDLAAEISDCGPAISGGGVLKPYAVPTLSRLLKGDPQNPTRKSVDMRRLVLEVTSFISRTVDILIAPPVMRSRVRTLRTPNVKVQVLVIHTGVGNLKQFDVSAIKEQLSFLPAIKGQSFKVEVSSHPINSVKHMAVAFMTALKSHTSSYYSTLEGELKVTTHPYLDAVGLHDFLRNNPNFEEMVKPPDHDTQIIPVVLFEVSSDFDVLLLDRYHQAVAFSDMILAVQASAPKIQLDMQCNGEWSTGDLRDARRPILSALLEVGWSVPPTGLLWSEPDNETESDYLWSLGLTPTGSLSQSLQLSFSARWLAARNRLYLQISSLLEETVNLFHHFDEFDKTLREVLSDSDYTELVRRWNLFQWKLTQATQNALASDIAMALLESAEADSTRIHQLMHTGGANIQTYLRCTVESPKRLSWTAAALLLLTTVFSALALLHFRVKLTELVQKKMV